MLSSDHCYDENKTEQYDRDLGDRQPATLDEAVKKDLPRSGYI